MQLKRLTVIRFTEGQQIVSSVHRQFGNNKQVLQGLWCLLGWQGPLRSGNEVTSKNRAVGVLRESNKNQAPKRVQ
jgi:hypothetical protein